MIPLYGWFCASASTLLLILGLMYFIGAMSLFHTASEKLQWEDGAFYRAWGAYRIWRGLPALCLGIGILVSMGVGTFGPVQAGLTAATVLIMGVIHWYAPTAPLRLKFYTEDGLDKKMEVLRKREVQKLLGRVGAFKNKAQSNDAYRELDALCELEEYLKNRVAKTE